MYCTRGSRWADIAVRVLWHPEVHRDWDSTVAQKPVALPFVRECEDIRGPSNGSPNSLWGNLSLEHERINGAL